MRQCLVNSSTSVKRFDTVQCPKLYIYTLNYIYIIYSSVM